MIGFFIDMLKKQHMRFIAYMFNELIGKTLLSYSYLEFIILLCKYILNNSGNTYIFFQLYTSYYTFSFAVYIHRLIRTVTKSHLI